MIIANDNWQNFLIYFVNLNKYISRSPHKRPICQMKFHNCKHYLFRKGKIMINKYLLNTCISSFHFLQYFVRRSSWKKFASCLTGKSWHFSPKEIFLLQIKNGNPAMITVEFNSRPVCSRPVCSKLAFSVKII